MDCPVLQTHSGNLGLFYAGFPSIRLGATSSLLFRSAVSVGFSSLVLTPLFITSPSLQLDPRSLAQRLAVCVCICFHQLLDEGSKMAYKVIINLIIGKGNLR